ncbi:MAG: hypothetical protein ACREBR_03510 [bacterium]
MERISGEYDMQAELRCRPTASPLFPAEFQRDPPQHSYFPDSPRRRHGEPAESAPEVPDRLAALAWQGTRQDSEGEFRLGDERHRRRLPQRMYSTDAAAESEPNVWRHDWAAVRSRPYERDPLAQGRARLHSQVDYFPPAQRREVAARHSYYGDSSPAAAPARHMQFQQAEAEGACGTSRPSSQKMTWEFVNACASPPSVAGFSSVSLLLCFRDRFFEGVFRNGERMHEDDCLFPGSVTREWRDQVHGNAQVGDASDWILQKERRECRGGSHPYRPHFHSAFFKSPCFEAFRLGRWRLFSDPIETDLNEYFTVWTFVLSLDGHQHPPRYSANGLDMESARLLLENMLWFFNLAVTDSSTTGRQIGPHEGEFYSASLLGPCLIRLLSALNDRDLRSQWMSSDSSRLRHTHTLFTHLAQLFEILGDWMTAGIRIQKVSHVDVTFADVKAAIPAIRKRHRGLGLVYDEIEDWDSKARVAFFSGFRSNIDLRMDSVHIPAYLMEERPKAAWHSLQPAPIQTRENEQASRSMPKDKGKPAAVWKKAQSCLLQWAPAASAHDRSTSMAEVIKATQERPPKAQMRVKDNRQVEKPICFAFTFADGRGCDGQMLVGKRFSKCNRVHLDMASEDWKTFSAEDLRPLLQFLKKPQVQRLLAPTQALQSSPFWPT